MLLFKYILWISNYLQYSAPLHGYFRRNFYFVGLQFYSIEIGCSNGILINIKGKRLPPLMSSAMVLNPDMSNPIIQLYLISMLDVTYNNCEKL